MKQMPILAGVGILVLTWLFYRQIKKSVIKNRISVTENGVWLIFKESYREDVTRPKRETVRKAMLEATKVEELIREKTQLPVKVQPVVVLADAKADLKFRFFQIERVYIVQKNWLEKLMGEYPPEHLDRDKIDKIQRIINFL